MMQVAARVYAFLDELKAHTELSAVLLVSHGGLCRVLNTYFEDIDNEAFFYWQMDNTEIRRYTLK
jgi:probable phosphoglycerate mutase